MSDYHPGEPKAGVPVSVPHLVFPTRAVFLLMELEGPLFFGVRQTFNVLRGDEIKMTALLFMRQQAWEPFTSSIPIFRGLYFHLPLVYSHFLYWSMPFFFSIALPILFKDEWASTWVDLTSTAQRWGSHHFLLTAINGCWFGTLPVCQHGLHPVSRLEDKTNSCWVVWVNGMRTHCSLRPMRALALFFLVCLFLFVLARYACGLKYIHTVAL